MFKVSVEVCVRPSRVSSQTCSSERLDPQTAADHPDSDPWRITEEQLEYYTNQFKSLQPDLGALILGRGQTRHFTTREDACSLAHG